VAGPGTTADMAISSDDLVRRNAAFGSAKGKLAPAILGWGHGVEAAAGGHPENLRRCRPPVKIGVGHVVNQSGQFHGSPVVDAVVNRRLVGSQAKVDVGVEEPAKRHDPASDFQVGDRVVSCRTACASKKFDVAFVYPDGVNDLDKIVQRGDRVNIPQQRLPMDSLTEDPLRPRLKDIHVERDRMLAAQAGKGAQIAGRDPLGIRTRHSHPEAPAFGAIPPADEAR